MPGLEPGVRRLRERRWIAGSPPHDDVGAHPDAFIGFKETAAVEHLEFDYPGGGAKPARTHALAGVVGSGNLEVMIEAAELGGRCAAIVDTSVRGFGETWERVLADFFARHGLSDVRLSINDGGATPAVVGLRLDQAAAEIKDA